MLLGLAQEAIAARARREAESESGWDAPPPQAPVRKTARNSQNSRYDRDLGNIASFDRAPPKPSFAMRSETSALQAPVSRNLDSFRYRPGGSGGWGAEGEQSIEGREGGEGNQGDIWRKIKVPVQAKALPSDLENILYPKPTAGQQLPPPSRQPSAYSEQAPARAPPPPLYYPGSTIRPIASPGVAGQHHQGSSTAHHQQGTPFQQPSVPYLPNGSHSLSPSLYLPGPDHQPSQQYPGGASNLNSHMPPPPHPLAQAAFAQRRHPYLPLPSAHQGHAAPTPVPRTADSFMEDFRQQFHPVAPPSYSIPTFGGPWQYPALAPSLPAPPLFDPLSPPVPMFDPRSGQWVLVPQPLPPSHLLPAGIPEAHTPPDHSLRQSKRPHESSSPSSSGIPSSLTKAFQTLETPTRPRRAPSRSDDRQAKTGRELVQSLEDQVEVEDFSSSADELNLRSGDEELNGNYEMADELGRPLVDGGQPVHSPPSRAARSVQPKSILSASKRDRQHRDDSYELEKPIVYEMGDEEHGESESYVQPAHRGERSNGGHTRRRDHQEPLRKKRRSQPHHRSPRHSSLDQLDQLSTYDPPARQTRRRSHDRLQDSRIANARARDRRRPHHTDPRQYGTLPPYPPSSTETDFSSGSETERDSFTSPSDTSESPSPAPERQIRVTEGAWAGYDVPDHLVQYEDRGRRIPIARRRSHRTKSVPLPIELRPRDQHGKFLPYATTRSESPNDSGGEEEEGDQEPGEEIENFSSPSQEDRWGGGQGRQGLSPVIEEDEEEEEAVAVEAGAQGSGRKKTVRWKDQEGPVRRGAENKKGVDRVPASWSRGGTQVVDKGVEGSKGSEQTAPGATGGGADSEQARSTGGGGEEGRGGYFGEGFFDTVGGGETGFTVWRD